MQRNKIIGSLVTTIEREKTLQTQLMSICFQVDTLYVTLNGFKKLPEYFNRFGNVIGICDPNNTTRDIAKLIISEEVESSFFFTFDDDLLYPENYVDVYLRKFEEHGKNVIICLHGTILKSHWKMYYNDRKVIHYFQPLDRDLEFDLAGTATTAFHTDFLKIKFDEIWDYDIGSDLWLAYFAYKKNMPLISIARKKNWVVCKPRTQNAGTPLYIKVAKDRDWQWRRNRFIHGWKAHDK